MQTLSFILNRSCSHHARASLQARKFTQRHYQSIQYICAGPTGKVLLLPPEKNAVHIMVATGTGIAPYRAYLRRMFMEDVPDYKFTGLAWLFMGVANSDARLYDDEFQAILQKYPKQVLRTLLSPLTLQICNAAKGWIQSLNGSELLSGGSKTKIQHKVRDDKSAISTVL